MTSHAFTDPIALFRAAVDTINAEEWIVAAGLCDPVSLRAFHRALLEQFAPAEPHVVLTAEEYMRMAPGTPAAVAEHYVAEHRRNSDPLRRLLRDLPGVSSVLALGAVPDGERVTHVIYRDAVEPTPGRSDPMAEWRSRQPPDEQELALGLSYRSYPRAATCLRQSDGGWLLVAGHDFLGMGSSTIADVREGDTPAGDP